MLEVLETINISCHHKLFRTLERFIRPYSIASFYHIILESRSDTKEASNEESIY